MKTRWTALAVGWDVGGWMGDKQAVAVIGVDASGQWEHLGEPKTFRIAEGHLRLAGLVHEAWPELEALPSRVVVGIDAPLAFPEAFGALITGTLINRTQAAPFALGQRELDNPLAYRETDRFISKAHDKKPLSASFDRLGNNATLAMTLVNAWRSEGLSVLPFDAPRSSGREALEVYPALYKGQAGLAQRVVPLLPKSVLGRDLRDDALDATLCAVSALAWLAPEDPRLPRLVPPEGEGPWAREGWIYAPDRRWLG